MQDYAYATSSNRLLTTQIGATTLNYTHDAHGNAGLPHLTVQQWDAKNRLQAVATQSVGSGTPETTYYLYDASGQRIRKVTDNAAAEGVTPKRKSERVYINGFEIYREYQSDGTTVDLEREALHVNDDAQRVALVETKTIDSGSAVGSPTPLQRFQLTTHLGSACLELNETADVITYEEYYPFGMTSFHSATASVPKRYRYTGKERDDESGLYYHGARYYAPWLGRWTAADPGGMKNGPNRYAYVRNSPVKFSDPNGLEAEEKANPNSSFKNMPYSSAEAALAKFENKATAMLQPSNLSWDGMPQRHITSSVNENFDPLGPNPSMRALPKEEYHQSITDGERAAQQRQLEIERGNRILDNVSGGIGGAFGFGIASALSNDPNVWLAGSQAGNIFDSFAYGDILSRPQTGSLKVDGH
ncbi:MAG: RHS repeat-associated core domain-containing protein [Deltaproteobacteria bacterium]|nr:RHS repeat-associated core domain-containing protein [Deltaproteobacteria bacterium]